MTDDLGPESPDDVHDQCRAGSFRGGDPDKSVDIAKTRRPPRVRNTRLQAAMQDRKISFAKLAAATGRNIKSVQRWVYEGRIPRNPQAAAIARLLHIDPNWLWPQVRATIHPDLINMYAHVGEMPHTIWTQSAVQADHAIDIAADSSPVLPFKLSDILAQRARAGVQVRLCLSASVVPGTPIGGVRMRTTLSQQMIGIYRFDEEMVVWLNQAGTRMVHQAPVLHLRQSEERGVFDFYCSLFEALWEGGEEVARHDEDWYRTSAGGR